MAKDSKNKPVISADEFRVITYSVDQAKEYVDEKIKAISWLMVGVVIVCFIGFVQLIIDSMHVNNATYREYSDKTQAVEDTQKTNSDLLNQNQANQELILEQQKEIRQLLTK